MRYYYIFYKIPEPFLTFFSGILISIAVNILTSHIPNVADLGWNFFVSSGCMFLSSIVLIVWTIYVKPLQQDLDTLRDALKDVNDNQESSNSSSKRTNCERWHNILVGHKNAKLALNLFFWLFIALFLASIIFVVI